MKTTRILKASCNLKESTLPAAIELACEEMETQMNDMIIDCFQEVVADVNEERILQMLKHDEKIQRIERILESEPDHIALGKIRDVIYDKC